MSSPERRSPVVVIICLLVIAACLGLGWSAWRHQHSPPKPEAAGAPVTGKAAAPVAVVPAEPAAAPLPAAELPPVIMVPLAPWINPEEYEVVANDEGLKRLPQGAQTYGGIDFTIDGFIHLQGLATRDEQNKQYRERVAFPLADLLGNQTIGCLHLLGGTRFSTTSPGEKFADVVWHYTDGTEGHSSIKYDVDLRDWSRKRYEQPVKLPNPLVKVAWKGEHPSRKDRSLRLYRLTVANPQPQKTLQQLEFVSSLNRPSLVFVALTLDPAKPGQRADDLTQDEWADPELKGLVKIFVQAPDGYPAVNARLRVAAQDALSKNQPLFQNLTTGADGSADVKFPTEGLTMLEVGAEHDDYGGRMMRWDLKAGDTVPQTYTLKLGGAMELGGTVINEAGNPIAGASVDVYRFWTGNDDYNKKGDQPNFNRSRQAEKTDAQGHWTIKGIPTELKNNLGLNFTHKEYLSTDIQLNNDPATTEQLTAGTHKMTLRQGLTIVGRVVGDVNQPMPGATVRLGQPYSSEKRSTKTDENGQFTLNNVAAGDQPLGVTAQGYGPSMRTVTVQKSMAELVIKLGGAHFVRGTVVDEQGSPLEGVSVELGWNSERVLQFSTKTDAAGKFTWDSAPAEPVKFSFSKAGYRNGQDKLLNPDTDNVVTLKRTQTIRGWVVDAATGQPLTKFRVGLGKSYNEGRNFYFTRGNGGQELTDPNGQFTLSLDSEDPNAIRASADDHADETQQLPAGQNGDIQITLRLKACPALRGIVTSADGTPLPGMSVVAIDHSMNGNSVSVRNGKIQGNGGGGVATTDSEGKFTLNSPPEEGRVIASGDAGFGETTVAQVLATGKVVVQTLGRIEGVLKVGGQPLAGELVRYASDINNLYYDTGGLGTKTDEQGRFTLEKIPAGRGNLIRLVQTSANSWTHSHKTPVLVEAGKTTQVTLGENGAVIRGTARLENPPEDAPSLRIHGNVEGYSFQVKPDGTFMLDSLPPGSYKLSVRAVRRRPGGESYETDTVASGSVPLEVPQDANPYQPINVGEIVLKPSNQ